MRYQGQKHMANKVSTFKKANSLVVMIAKSGRLSAMGRKILNLLLLYTWNEIRLKQKAGEVITAEHMFSAPILDISGKVSRGDSDPRSLVKKYCLDMRRMVVDWSSPDARNGVIFKDMNVLSEVDFEIRNGVCWVLWSFPPSIMKEIASENGLYSWMDIEEMLELDSYAAIALFDICSRYKDNPSAVTNKEGPDWWTKALSNSNVTKADGSEKFRDWRKVKYEILNDAIEDVNKKTRLTIELIETRIGKSVVAVQFGIQKKKVESTSGDMPKVDYQIAMIAARLDVALPAVSKLSKDGFSDDDIRLGFTQLESRMRATNLDAIENKVAYLRKVMEGNNERTRPSIQIDQPKVLTLSDATTWVDERRTEVRKEFELLIKEEQYKFALQGLELLKKVGLFTTSHLRSVSSGDWRKGIILVKAVEAYAVEKYGENWLTES
jgi:Initiator Replication protein